MPTTNHLTVKIKTRDDTELSDETIVRECMEPLMENHKSVTGYTFYRSPDDEWVYIFLYGEFEIP